MTRFWGVARRLDAANALSCRYLVLFAHGHTDANEWEGSWKQAAGDASIEGYATREEAEAAIRERMADVPDILTARVFNLANLHYAESGDQPIWLLND